MKIKHLIKTKSYLLTTVSLLSIFLFTFFSLSSSLSVSATTLSDLPFGSVIKIQPTDDNMCDDATCSATTANVLPFKFVKMQARQTDLNATPYGDVSGYNISGQNYTYWMLLDNYCWWGKSDCHISAGTRSILSAYNDSPETAGGTNNISDPLTFNILNTLANFYESLPAEIGAVAKETAVPVFAWDMNGVSLTNPPTISWAGGTWNNTTYNPNSDTASQFTFTGNETVPVMNSRISLVSFHEWQGGNTYYRNQPDKSDNNGSGNSYCLARFGTANCAAVSGNMFDQNNLLAGNQTTGGSAANPRPSYPWVRSPYTTNATYVWAIHGHASNSLLGRPASTGFGVSPTLWLSADIAAVGGNGTYTQPFCLTGDLSCQLQLLNQPTALWDASSQVLTVSGNLQYSLIGETVDIFSFACNTAGDCVRKSGTIITNGDSQGYAFAWTANELATGNYDGSLWVTAHPYDVPLGQQNVSALSNQINFLVSSRILDLTVARHQFFNLVLGDANIFNLSLGTDPISGITASVDPTTNDLIISGTLTQDTQATFGSIILNFKTFAVPQSSVVETSLTSY